MADIRFDLIVRYRDAPTLARDETIKSAVGTECYGSGYGCDGVRDMQFRFHDEHSAQAAKIRVLPILHNGTAEVVKKRVQPAPAQPEEKP